MPIKEQSLDLNSLADLGDGELGVLFRNQLLRLSRDCIDRPGVKLKRKLILEFTAVPICDSNGDLHHVAFEVGSKLKTPDYWSAPFQMRATVNGLQFNKDFPDQLNQNPLFDSDEEA